MRAVVMRVEPHRNLTFGAGLYREIEGNELLEYFVRE